MKRPTVLLLFLVVCFPLAAQSHADISVYVPHVVGAGSRPEDNYFFYRLLVYELTEQKYAVAKTKAEADYSLVGGLAQYAGGEGEPASAQYIFYMELVDNKTGEVTVNGELLYEAPNNASDLLPVLVYTLLNTIPGAANNQNDWRNKLLYVGGSAFWNPRMYFGDMQSAFLVNFSGGIFAEYHFLNFMSAEIGLGLAIDSVNAYKDENYRNLLLESQLLLKFALKPGAYLMLEPYIGIRYNFPFYDTTNPPMFSGLAGFQYGVKIGSGVLVIDPRFALDIGKSSLEAASGETLSFQRYAIYIGIGYKYGFIARKDF
jgi:hypothetical protein